MLAADCSCLGGVRLWWRWLAAVLAPNEDLEFSDPMESARAMERVLRGRCGIFCHI